jgi:hypothetical protein
MRAFAVDAAPVDRLGVQQRAFVKQLFGQRRQEPLQPRAFQDPAAQRVDHGDRTAALRFDQPDDPQPRVGSQVQRIGIVGVHSPQHHIDTFQRAQRTHPQFSVADHQIGAFHQRETQHRGEISLVECGFGVDARTQHHDDRVLGNIGRGIDQGQPQCLNERRRRSRPDPLVQVRDGVRDHTPIRQRVPGARRCLRPVGIDAERAIGGAADIAAVHEQLVATGNLDAARGPQIAGMGEQQLRRQHAARDRALRAVKVGQHHVEQPRPLHQPGFQHLPVGCRQHQRQPVEEPWAGLGRAVAVADRVAVLVDLDVGDAVVVDQALHHRAQPLQSRAPPLADRLGQLGPGRAQIAGFVDEFVVARGGSAAQLEQPLLGPRSSIAGQQVVDVVPVGCAGRQACQRCHYSRTVRTRRRSRMPGAPMSVDSRACFSRMSDRSTCPGVKPLASKRRLRRDSAATALTGGSS